MSTVVAGEAFTFQIILGLSIVICLFYFQFLVSDYASTISGAANVLGGGTLSGGLHALSGPDHLAAILPFILGYKWYEAAYFGALWGLGHGLAASLLGILGFQVKDTLLGYNLLPQLTNFADYAVGVTLIIIGTMGIHECQECNIIRENNGSDDVALTLSEVRTLKPFEIGGRELEEKSRSIKVRGQKVLTSVAIPITIFANGCFLGMSWDGLPSLAPALALYSWQHLFAFLAAYCLGTVLTIATASGFIGESTRWLSTVTSVDLPRRLALVSSFCAIAMGTLWILQALLRVVEMSGREREDAIDVESQSQIISRGIGCMIALGSPIALVGVIILAFKRKGDLKSVVDARDGEARRTKGVSAALEETYGECDTTASLIQVSVETENGWSRKNLKSHKVGFGIQPISRLNMEISSVSII